MSKMIYNNGLDTELLNKLIENILSGEMSPQQLIERLRLMIEAECAKATNEQDMHYIQACEDLMWRLEPIILNIAPHNFIIHDVAKGSRLFPSRSET